MRKQQLSPARTRLLEQCQELNFGRIRHLQVEKGEPVMDPPPRCIEEKVFGKNTVSRSERALVDFSLKAQAKDFFAYLDQLQDGLILELVIRDGLPFQVRRIRK